MAILSHIFVGPVHLHIHRREPVEKSSWILSQNSLAKTIWDWLILLATFYLAFVIPYEVSFMPKEVDERPTIGLDIAVEVFFVLDIIINFRTTYLDKEGLEVYNARDCAIHYARTWFIVDLVAALPIDLLHVFHIDVSSFIHLLKTVRLLRLLRLVQKLDHYSQHSSLVLTLLMSVFTLLAHWMACIWFLVGQNGLKGTQWHVAWLYELGERQETPYINLTTGGPSEFSSYIAALYFTFTSMTTVGFGNVSPNTNSEKIFAIVLMLIGSLMHAMIFGNVTAIIHRMYSRRSMYHTRMQDLDNFIRANHIPPDLKKHMLDSFQTAWTGNNRTDNELLELYSDNLRVDINMHLYKEILQLALFRECSPGCLRALSLHIKSLRVRDDFLIHQSDVLKNFYFVLTGSLEVLHNNIVLETLERGSLIGSNPLDTTQYLIADVDVKAVEYCELQVLSVQGLREVLCMYPECAPLFKANISNNIQYDLQQVVHVQVSAPCEPQQLNDQDATISRFKLGLPRIATFARRRTFRLTEPQRRYRHASNRCGNSVYSEPRARIAGNAQATVRTPAILRDENMGEDSHDDSPQYQVPGSTKSRDSRRNSPSFYDSSSKQDWLD